MALGALTLSTTQGVQGRPFQAQINGLTTGKVEVLVDGAPGFWVVNGSVYHDSLPYAPTSTVVLREYEPGATPSFRDSRIAITTTTKAEIEAQAASLVANGRSLVKARLGALLSGGSLLWTVYATDDYGATTSATAGGFTFAAVNNAALSTQTDSNTVTMSGLSGSQAITISGGTYSKNGGGFTGSAGSVVNGDTITLRATSSASYSTGVTVTVTIAGVPYTWTITTLAAGVPAQVGVVTPTSGNGQVALAWSAPANGGSAITDYLVEYKASASGTWLTFSDGVSSSTGATVTGLTNGTPYDFRVSAINAIGTGASSTPVSATPAAVVLPTGALTLTAIPSYEDKRPYQRVTTTGGGQGKGQGAITLAISGASAGTINVRIVDATTPTTVLQTCATKTLAGGESTITISDVDARYGWFYIELQGSDGIWQRTSQTMGMGAVFAGAGQSLMVRFMAVQETNGTLASNSITPDPCSSALIYAQDTNTYPTATTYVDQPWQTPADRAAGTGANGVGVASFLNHMIGLLGVNCGFVGAAVGGTRIDQWLPGGAHVAKLTNLMGRAGGAFEGFFWGQGHGNSSHGQPPKGYASGLDQLFANVVTPNNSFAGYGKFVWTIPAIRSAAWGTTFLYNWVRKGGEDWCAANGAYHVHAPDISQIDGIHQNQAGNVAFARAWFRAAKARYAADTSHLGPQLLSVTRTNTAGGVIFTFTFSDVGQTTLVQVGDFTKRIFAFPKGKVDRPGVTNNRFPFDAGSFTIVNKTTATATMTGNDPGDGQDLDIYMYWLNGPTHASDNFFAESHNLYDDRTEGLPRGRAVQHNTVPKLCAAPTLGGTVNNSPNDVARVSPFSMVETTTTYGAAYDAAYGNQLTGGYGQAGAASCPTFYPLTIEGRFVAGAAPGSTKVLFGGFGAAAGLYIDITGTNRIHCSASGLGGGSTPLVQGTQYAVALCLGPSGSALYLTVLTDNLGNPITPVTTREAFNATPVTLAPQSARFQLHNLGTSFIPVGVASDEWAVFAAERYTSLADYTANRPTAPFTGTEANIVALYRGDGDLKDAIAA